MKKIYCDICEQPMKENLFVTADVVFKNGSTHLHYVTPHEDKKSDVCKYCIIDAFKKLDDRQPAKAMRGELGDHSKLSEVSSWFPLADPKPVIMTVDVARYGNERTQIRLHGKTGDGPRMVSLPSGARLIEMADRVEQLVSSMRVDFVCVDPSGVGTALVDTLAHRGKVRLLQ